MGVGVGPAEAGSQLSQTSSQAVAFAYSPVL